MKVSDLRDELKNYPDDASIELGKLIAIGRPGEHEGEFEVILDFPIIGIAHNEKENEIRLIVEANPSLLHFGKVTRIDVTRADEEGP